MNHKKPKAKQKRKPLELVIDPCQRPHLCDKAEVVEVYDDDSEEWIGMGLQCGFCKRVFDQFEYALVYPHMEQHAQPMNN